MTGAIEITGVLSGKAPRGGAGSWAEATEMTGVLAGAARNLVERAYD